MGSCDTCFAMKFFAEVHGPDLNHSDNCGSLGIIVIYIYVCVCVFFYLGIIWLVR